MKKFAILLTLLILFTPLLLSARNQSAFLKEGVGAKAKALGGAYEAMVDDPTAVYWNPAGLARIYGEEEVKKKKKRKKKKKKKTVKAENKKPSLLDELPKLDEDIDDFSDVQTEKTFAFQWNFSSSNYGSDVYDGRFNGFTAVAFNMFGGTIGMGALHTQTNGIIGANTSAEQTGDFSYKGTSGFLAYGKEKGNLRYGITGKYIQESVDTSSYSGGGMDAGMQIDLFGSFIRIGLVFQDLLSAVSSPVEDGYDMVDRTMAFAITMNPPTANNVYLSLGNKTNLSHTEESKFSLGISYEMKYLVLNLGYSEEGISSGFGITFNHFTLDFSFAQNDMESEYVSSVEMNLKF